MSATAFQRRRREAARRAAEAEKAKEASMDQEEEQTPGAGQDDAENGNQTPLKPDDVDNMELDQVKALLDQLEVKYAHNTGEAKLRERLKDAIG